MEGVLRVMKRQKNNQLNHRELMLILILATVCVVYIGYRLNKPVYEQLLEQTEQMELAQLKYETFSNNVSNISNLKTDIENLNNQLDELKSHYPESLTQSYMLRKIKTNEDKTSVSVKNIAFNERLRVKPNAYEAFQGIEGIENIDSLDVSEWEVELALTGTEQDIISFIEKFEDDEHFITVDNVSFVATDEEVTTAMSLKFYNINYEVRANEEMLPIPLDPSEERLPIMGSSIAPNKKKSASSLVYYQPDFALIVSSYLENGAKFIFSQRTNSDSELLKDVNSNIDAILTIESQTDNVYSYSIQLDGEVYSGHFEPQNDSNQLLFNIYSESRTGMNDQTGITLTVNNQTESQLTVYVRNDDKENPRVRISKQSGKVLITDEVR